MRVCSATYPKHGHQEPRELRPDNLMYFAPYPEAMNPYGVSIFRSCEFGSQVFSTINNTIMTNFERWGDPSLHAHYRHFITTTD